MSSRNVCSLRSLAALCLLAVCCSGHARAQDLNLAGLDALEVSPPAVAAAPAPLDLSGLDQLSQPLSVAGGLQLSGLQELEHVARKAAPAAQLVLPAAVRPPAAVPATTAPAGVFCVGGQCYFRPPKVRGRKGR